MTSPTHILTLSKSKTPRPARCVLRSSFVIRASSFILLLLLSGCTPYVDTHYGQRQSPGPTESVNGTSVLGDMFTQSGHKVYSWPYLSPRLNERADCIVWFPDDYKPPALSVRQWLDTWLADKPGRTLIYVGRDYDAGPVYWQKVAPAAPPAQTTLVQSRLSSEKSRVSGDRASLPTKEDCDWFTLDSTGKPFQVKTLKGDPAWLEGVDPAKVEIELQSRLEPPASADVLLSSNGEVLVSETQVYGSRRIVVANGSFLLNMPLVNHEHRKLAGKLIDEIGSPGQKVVFLESEAGGPPIHDKDPALSAPTGLEIFQLWPTNWILLHLSVVGVIFCFMRWPIFGLARRLKHVAPSDFGRHIAAEAEMLKRSHDHTYATARLMHYRQTVGEKEK